MKTITIKSILLVATSLLIIGLPSCKKEGCMDEGAYNYNWDAEKDNGGCKYRGMLQVNVNPTFNGQAVSFDDVYHNVMGYRIQFTSIRFYTTNAKLGNDGDWEEVNSVAQFNYSLSNLLYRAELVPSSFSELTFDIGVDSVRNHSDPSTYDTDHPLSTISSSGMFWSWNSGYRFVVIEGVFDTDSLGTGVPPTPFSYHLGLDPYLRTNTQSVSLNITENMTTELNFDLMMDQFFYNSTDTLDMNQYPTIHSNPGQESIVEMLVDNFNRSLVLE